MTAAQRLVSHEQVPVRFTADEFMELAQYPPVSEWVGKIELVEGEIVRMSPANIPHFSFLSSILFELKLIFRPLGREWVVGPEPAVRMAKRTIRSPDVAVFRNPDMAGKVFDVADLFIAVEVSDTTLAVDLGAKLRDYARAGVPHYWVVDLNNRRTLVMTQPEAGAYTATRPVEFGEPLAVPETDATITIA